MKNVILSALILFAFTACRKMEKAEANKQLTQLPLKDTTVAVKYDTIIDHTTFNVRLVKDSTWYNDIQIAFNHSFSLGIVNNEDSRPFGLNPEFSKAGVRLDALSTDGQELDIDGLPYKPGLTIGLEVRAVVSGPVFLGIWRVQVHPIPPSIRILLQDNYLKDSLDLRKGNYYFNIDNTNPNTYGKNRFKLILKP